MFILTQRALGDTAPFEWQIPATGVTPAPGLAMKRDAGKLALAVGTDRPELICAGPARMDGCAPAYRILPDMEFTVTADENIPAAFIGQCVTISAAGDGITNTTVGGVFTITAANGTKTVRGIFL